MNFSYDSVGSFEIVAPQFSSLDGKKVLAFTANLGDIKQTPEQYASNTGEYYTRDVFGVFGGDFTYLTLKGYSIPITPVENTYQQAYLADTVTKRDSIDCNCRVLFTPFNCLLAWSSGTSATSGTTFVAVVGQPVSNSADFVIYELNETLASFYNNIIGD